MATTDIVEYTEVVKRYVDSKIQIPCVIIQDFYLYTGRSLGPKIMGLDTAHTIVTGDSAIEPGSYTLVIALKDKSTTWVDGTTNDLTYSYEIAELPEIVTWANGTYDQLQAMLDAHTKGIINIYDYWNVGDERVVSLSAMSSYGNLTDTHVAQDVVMVLMNEGGKELVDFEGNGYCTFIVGQKDCLGNSSTDKVEAGKMNYNKDGTTYTNIGGWDACQRREWCNDVYYNALPSELKSMIKKVINKTGSGGTQNQVLIDSEDWIAFPALTEVLAQDVSSYTLPGEGTQFEYYKTEANIPKYKYKDNSTQTSYHFRSPSVKSDAQFMGKSASGYTELSINYSHHTHGIAPFFCI